MCLISSIKLHLRFLPFKPQDILKAKNALVISVHRVTERTVRNPVTIKIPFPAIHITGWVLIEGTYVVGLEWLDCVLNGLQNTM
jgi:hypothetical protein